jgi:uncharacterized protein with von Willebrand factor type A (vWA) domain
MLKGNEAMTVAEILEEWGILDSKQAEQVSQHMRSRGVSVHTAINTLFEHVTQSLLDRAIKRREAALEYLGRAVGGGLMGGMNGSTGESAELKAKLAEMQRKMEQMKNEQMQQDNRHNNAAMMAGRGSMSAAQSGVAAPVAGGMHTLCITHTHTHVRLSVCLSVCLCVY